MEVLTDVENGHIVEKVTWLRPDERLHLLLRKDIPNHWFFFALKGVRGKTLTIEIEAQTTIHDLGAWNGVQPVMADSADISDPLLYDEAAYQRRYGKLPWRRIEKARYAADFRTLTITTTFAADEATIAFKYPCPVSYVENRLRQLSLRAAASNLGIYSAGQPAAEPPLRILTIPSMNGGWAARWKEKPTVLIYGGEHATEHESSQVVMGALEWLLGDSPQAKSYRDAYNVILIPHLFPYETTISRFNLLTEGFVPSELYVTGEANVLWAKYFNAFVDGGNFVDVAISMHNTAGSETVNFYCPLVQQLGDDLKFTEPLNRDIMAAVKTRGWKINEGLGSQGNWDMRLSGWLGSSFKSTAIFYEINGQKPDSLLSLTQVRSTGEALLSGTKTFFDSPLFAAQRAREKQRLVLREQRKAEHPVKAPYDPNNPPYWWIFNAPL